MKVLMIGGTGNISSAVTELLINQGHDLYLYCLDNGGLNELGLDEATLVFGNINDEITAAAFLEKHTFDVVVDWTIMTKEQLERDIRLFKGKTSQFILISSASVYQRPSKNYLITEDTPIENPYWDYSQKKIECENLAMKVFKEEGFPVTIVRPTLTYGNTIVPYSLSSWTKPWSMINRMRTGKRVIIAGDGTSVWVITHNSDFAKGIVGLMGKAAAIGEAFHITSEEVMTWNEIVNQFAEVLGVEPKVAHISTEFISAFMPEQFGGLAGDKSTSVVFDLTKLRSLVPDFKATVSLKEGFTRTVAYLDAHPELQLVDEEYEAVLDRVIAAHDYGMSLARGI